MLKLAILAQAVQVALTDTFSFCLYLVPLYASNEVYSLSKAALNQIRFQAWRCHFMLHTGAILCFKSQLLLLLLDFHAALGASI